MILALLFGFFLVLRAQTFTNTLYVMNTVENSVMVFNIKINGVNYFNVPQTVANTGDYVLFPFQRTLEDVVEVIFENGEIYPGYWHIMNEYNLEVFFSRALNFFIVNQCTLDEGCNLFVNTDGFSSFPAGFTANIYVNGNEVVTDYDGQGPVGPLSVQKGQSINVKISAYTGVQFGMNFVMRKLNGNLLDAITWYNQNLATQMVVKNVYFTYPLEGITAYANTNLPVSLVSYPEAIQSDVLMVYIYPDGTADVASAQTIPTNTPNPENFLLPGYINGLPTNDFMLWASYGKGTSLNFVNFKFLKTVPTSIKFASPKPGTVYTAGSAIPVRLYSVPDAGNFMVQLKCENLEPLTRTIRSNTERDQAYPVPLNYYGQFCIMSINYPIYAGTAIRIVLAKLVFVKSPKYVLNGEDFVVKIETFEGSGIQTVDLEMICRGMGQVALWTGVDLNEFVSLRLDNPNLNNGPFNCELKTVLVDTFEQISTNVIVYIQMTQMEIAQFKQMNGFRADTQWLLQQD